MKTNALLKILKIQDYIFSLHDISEIKKYLSIEISSLPGIYDVVFSESESIQSTFDSNLAKYPIVSNNISFGFLLISIKNWAEFNLYEHYLKNLTKVVGFVFHENYETLKNQEPQSFGFLTQNSKAVDNLEAFEKMIDLMKNVRLFFLILNKSGKIIYCNNYFLCQTGYINEELIYQDWFEFFAEKQMIQNEKEAFNLSIKKEERYFNFEKYIITKDGDKLWVSWNNSFVFDKEKNITGLICFGENITQRKIAEDAFKDALNNQKHIIVQLEESKAKAEESDKLKTAFLQNMSHEIRTPMNAIMGFSELLVHYYNDKEKLEQFSNIINQRCEDLLAIINDILDIAKIESGQHNLKLEECNLENLFDELKLFFTEFQKKVNKENIEFRIIDSCPTEGCIIITDKIKLKQILINLINNAYKFTNNGSIEVGCTLNGNNLHFYVSDTGIGIPLDKQKIIFDRFTQVQFDIKNGGTGLGLSIVKGLVKLLGGTIGLKSEYGKGSTFSFTIPYIKSIDNTSIKYELSENDPGSIII